MVLIEQRENDSLHCQYASTIIRSVAIPLLAAIRRFPPLDESLVASFEALLRHLVYPTTMSRSQLIAYLEYIILIVATFPSMSSTLERFGVLPILQKYDNSCSFMYIQIFRLMELQINPSIEAIIKNLKTVVSHNSTPNTLTNNYYITMLNSSMSVLSFSFLVLSYLPRDQLMILNEEVVKMYLELQSTESRVYLITLFHHLPYRFPSLPRSVITNISVLGKKKLEESDILMFVRCNSLLLAYSGESLRKVGKNDSLPENELRSLVHISLKNEIQFLEWVMDVSSHQYCHSLILLVIEVIPNSYVIPEILSSLDECISMPQQNPVSYIALLHVLYLVLKDASSSDMTQDYSNVVVGFEFLLKNIQKDVAYSCAYEVVQCENE